MNLNDAQFIFSIRNHNGQTPSQLAADCGYQDCAAYIERAAQIEQAQGVCSLPSVNPSKDLRTEQNGVVTNGNAMEDDDMDTDLMPSSYKVNPLAGIKRGRDDCDDEECKKSRRDGMVFLSIWLDLWKYILLYFYFWMSHR